MTQELMNTENQPPRQASPYRPRGTGSVYRQKRSANLWIQYYRNGKVYRESSHTTDRRKAQKLLLKKLGEIANHNFIEPRAARTLIGELAQDLFQDYRVNEKKSLASVEARWKHLAKRFSHVRAANLDKSELMRYVEDRQREGASNATINRELAALKRMFSLGVDSRKVQSAPRFPRLEERNVRKGFVEDAQHEALAKACANEGLWLRAMFEVAYSFGWRKSELLNLRVRQVDLASRTIRLEPGETKNDEGRTVVMTGLVYALLQHCIVGKQPEDYVFTRDDGQPVRDFRGAWARICTEAKTPGLLFHDLRRTAVRNMVRRGIPERVAMTISGHKTRAVFDRYFSIATMSSAKPICAKLHGSSIASSDILQTYLSILSARLRPSRISI